MSTPLLTTKLNIPPPRSQVVLRPRLSERLNEGLDRKLTLVSAPAGFGKTTLVSEWLSGSERRAAWLSLDQGDNDAARFLMYLAAALRTVVATIGEGALAALGSPQPPAVEALLTGLLNAVTCSPEPIVLVLDDYHVIDAKPVDHALTFLLDHLPPRMHVVIATREDPQLPLARLRVSGQLTELRVADLRFTPSEASMFLNRTMGLNLSFNDIAALETRTEGWIAGLQLAAISLQGHADAAGFITSFTGSHRFVMDYLMEEVLQQQSGSVQSFLLRTSILERLCGPLCDAVTLDPSTPGQATLEYLERANLFIVPLDTERRWYRYHHLFADLLRQRLRQSAVASPADEGWEVAELHRRASQWLEDHGLEIDAFQHAAAANDFGRAERLVEGKGVPLHFRGAVAPVLAWLESLPPATLDAWPALWTSFASVLLATGQNGRIEPTLQAAEKALQVAEPDEKTRDLIGRIAAIRSSVAGNEGRIDTLLAQSRRALEYLSPHNRAFQTSTAWKLGFAYYMQGDRVASRRALTDVVAIGQESGNTIYTLLALTCLGILDEGDNQLPRAAETYRRVLRQMGDVAFAAGGGEAHLGLARICYEWNELDDAERHARQCLEITRQDQSKDGFVSADAELARLKLARGDVAGAAAQLARSGAALHEMRLPLRAREVIATHVLMHLHQGNLEAATQAAQAHILPVSLARVRLAQGDASAALAALRPWREQAEAKGWADERLKALALEAVALQAHGAHDQAARTLDEALALAEPGGFIRLFVDEGPPMARLLSAAATRGTMRDYVAKLLSAFDAEAQRRGDASYRPAASLASGGSVTPVATSATSATAQQPLVEPLSHREVEVLQLIAQGLSNQEICERLYLALDTVKGHNRKIFEKLQVQRRTEAVAKARELGLL